MVLKIIMTIFHFMQFSALWLSKSPEALDVSVSEGVTWPGEMERKWDFENTAQDLLQFQKSCRQMAVYKERKKQRAWSLSWQTLLRVAEEEAAPWGALRWPRGCRGCVSNESRSNPPSWGKHRFSNPAPRVSRRAAVTMVKEQFRETDVAKKM